MAVLALVLVMMLQVTTGILGSTRAQNQQMDSVASARRALDAIDADIRKALINDTTSVLVSTTSPELALLAQRRGASATEHRFLSVRYSTNSSNQIIRTYASVPFSEANLTGLAATNPGTPSTVADGILAFQIRIATPSAFFLPNAANPTNWATTNYNGVALPTGWRALITAAPSFAQGLTNRAQSVRIWLAAADDQTMSLLKSSGQLATAQSILSAQDHARDWRAAIDNSAIAPQAKSSIRILQKTIPLP